MPPEERDGEERERKRRRAERRDEEITKLRNKCLIRRVLCLRARSNISHPTCTNWCTYHMYMYVCSNTKHMWSGQVTHTQYTLNHGPFWCVHNSIKHNLLFYKEAWTHVQITKKTIHLYIWNATLDSQSKWSTSCLQLACFMATV